MMPGRLIFHEECTALGDPQKAFSMWESWILGGPDRQMTTTVNSCPPCTEQRPEAQKGWVTVPVSHKCQVAELGLFSEFSFSRHRLLFTFLEGRMG